MHTETVKPFTETSPVTDVLFLKLLALTVENCQKAKSCKYCPVFMQCNSWFNGISQRSAMHNLTLKEFNHALRKFNKL